MTARKAAAGLAGAALLAGVLAGCATDQAAKVCVDKKTQQRLPASDCDQPSTAGQFFPVWWYYYGSGRIAPVGQKVTGGEETPPKGATSKPLSDKSSGKAPGSSGKGFGGSFGRGSTEGGHGFSGGGEK